MRQRNREHSRKKRDRERESGIGGMGEAKKRKELELHIGPAGPGETRLPAGGHGDEALAINHCQAGFVKEAGPAVLEEPDRENGEGEQQDEDEQIGAVLPVALLSLLLGHDLLIHGSHHSAGAVRSPGPAKDAQREEQPERPREPAGPGAVAANTPG